MYTRVWATPLRLPVFVLCFTHGTATSDDHSRAVELRSQPQPFTAVVGGTTGAVGCERLVSAPKARAAAAAPVAALGAALAACAPAGDALGFLAEAAFASAAAGLVAGSVAGLLPARRAAAQEEARLRDGAHHAAGLPGGGDGGADEGVQAARDRGEWDRWEGSALWRYDPAARLQWARTLWAQQAARARMRRQWRAAQAAAAAQAAEAQRRAHAKAGRIGVGGAGRDARPGAVPRDPRGYYRALGLELRAAVATQAEIRAAFLKAAQRLHPDKHAAAGGDVAAATEKFRHLQTAYATLRDPHQRARYRAEAGQ